MDLFRFSVTKNLPERFYEGSFLFTRKVYPKNALKMFQFGSLKIRKQVPNGTFWEMFCCLGSKEIPQPLFFLTAYHRSLPLIKQGHTSPVWRAARLCLPQGIVCPVLQRKRTRRQCHSRKQPQSSLLQGFTVTAKVTQGESSKADARGEALNHLDNKMQLHTLPCSTYVYLNHRKWLSLL